MFIVAASASSSPAAARLQGTHAGGEAHSPDAADVMGDAAGGEGLGPDCGAGATAEPVRYQARVVRITDPDPYLYAMG